MTSGKKGFDRNKTRRSFRKFSKRIGDLKKFENSNRINKGKKPIFIKRTAPFNLKKPLAFCQFNGTACCNSREDLKLQRQFEAINIVFGNCSPFLKLLLCSILDTGKVSCSHEFNAHEDYISGMTFASDSRKLVDMLIMLNIPKKKLQRLEVHESLNTRVV